MNKKYKILQFVLVAVFAFIAFARPVFAAGAVKVAADKSTCAVGDTVKVTVSADNPADASVAPEISVTYNPRRLEFKDCSVSYGGGGGGLISLTDTSADITFTVLSGGTASVDVSAIFDGDGANAKTAGVSIEVEGEDIAAQNDSETPMDLGIEGGSISSSDANKLVAAVFADEFMPMGFYKTSVTYEEQLVEAAQFDMGNILLLYVTDENGNNGNFNVYNPNTGELSDFLQISGIENRFIIALRATDADSEPPEGFTLATLKWNEQTLDAYSHDNLNDFFLLYAISSEGNRGWYLYDQNEGTYQRFVNELYAGNAINNSAGLSDDLTNTDTDSAEQNEKESKKPDGLDVKLILIIALIAVVLGLLVAVIIMGVKLKDYDSYEYIDEDEYEAPYKKPDKNFEYDVNRDARFVNPANKPASENIIKQPLENKSDIRKNSLTNNKIENKPEDKPEKKITASDLVEREMGSDILNSEMPKTDNIYEKYRAMDEQKQNTAVEHRQPAPPENMQNIQDNDYENDIYEDEEKLSREERKALKAEEKARKKAEKKMKKEYGEFGPANFSQWQEAVRDDRKVSEDDLLDAKSRAVNPADMLPKEKPQPEKPVAKPPVVPKAPQEDVIQPKSLVPEKVNKPIEEYSQPKSLMPKAHQSIEKPQPEKPQPAAPKMSKQEKKAETDDIKKDSYVKMLKNLPANDKNEPVQPKPVQQFDLDEDFEFEYLSIDDD